MSIDISLTIEEIVKEKHISYIEAILEYTNEIDGEIEGVAKMINKSIEVLKTSNLERRLIDFCNDTK